MLKRRQWRCWLMAAWCVFLGGCVTKSVDNAGISFHYQSWVPIGLFLVGVMLVPLGLVVMKRSGRLGSGLTVVGTLAALGFAPSLYLERVLVHDQGFEVHSGLWGTTANQQLAFDSVAAVRIAEKKTGGRGRRQIEVLQFEVNGGPPRELPLNNGVKIEAAKEIVLRARQRQIPVNGVK